MPFHLGAMSTMSNTVWWWILGVAVAVALIWWWSAAANRPRAGTVDGKRPEDAERNRGDDRTT